jgi:hypothetical protein
MEENLYFVKSGIKVKYKEIKTFSWDLRFSWRSIVVFWVVFPRVNASDKLLRNLGNRTADYTASQLRRPEST